VYTVASPEACAAILWKDAGRSSQAAEALKITAWDLKGLGILDQLLPEPIGGAHADPIKAAAILKAAIQQNLDDLLTLSSDELRRQRYQKFRQIGVFNEVAA
ncbi:MAG: acetyl-CoA carboxylase carboxyl transferase subunit alpha, partial [Cyanobacteria bacterium P01_C01_bin.73]